MKYYIQSPFLCIMLFLFFCEIKNVVAQEIPRCGTSISYPKNSSKAFENKIDELIKTNQTNHTRARRGTVKYQLPVVVHVIHSGESIGTGSNISDEQIINQIQSTNEDLLGDNNWNDTVAIFKDKIEFTGIELVLAKQDPFGQPTTGIVRINGRKKEWIENEIEIVRSLSQWPSKDYINIWVLDISDSFFAIADFPQHPISGLSESYDGSINSDKGAGVFIDYLVFGNKNKGNYELKQNYDLGKTLTHELGHYLGLLHIWGVKGCDASDFVSDTPVANVSSSKCNLTKTSCGSLDMIQNFMDYSYDRCMTLFTSGQVQRMEIVLLNSPIRKLLLTSHGLDVPTQLDTHLAITQFISTENSCKSNYPLRFQLTNYGKKQVNNVKLLVKKNDTIIKEISLTLDLKSGNKKNISEIEIPLQVGENDVFVEISEVNNQMYPTNRLGRTKQKKAYYSPESELPFLWSSNTIENWYASSQWKNENQISDAGTSEKVLVADTEDMLNINKNFTMISKSFYYTPGTDVKVNFEYAYYNKTVDLTDRLFVWSSVCDNEPDFFYKNEKINLYDEELKTMDTIIPKSMSVWYNQSFTIPYRHWQKKLQIFFLLQNNQGGKLYINKLEIVQERSKVNQLVPISPIIPVICPSNPILSLEFKNNNSNLVNYQWIIKNSNNQILNRSEVITTILPNQDFIVPFDFSSLPNLSEKSVYSGGFEIQVLNQNLNIIFHKMIMLSISENKEILDNKLSINKDGFEKWISLVDGVDFPLNNWNYNIEKNGEIDEHIFSIEFPKHVTYTLLTPKFSIRQNNNLKLLFDVLYQPKVGDNDTSLSIYIRNACNSNWKSFYNSTLSTAIVNFDNDWKNFQANIPDSFLNEDIQLAFQFNNKGNSDFYIKNIRFWDNNIQILSLYPNPVDNNFVNTIVNSEYETNAKLEIINNYGELMKNYNIQIMLNENNYRFYVGDLYPSTYFLRIFKVNEDDTVNGLLAESIRFIVY